MNKELEQQREREIEQIEQEARVADAHGYEDILLTNRLQELKGEC